MLLGTDLWPFTGFTSSVEKEVVQFIQSVVIGLIHLPEIGHFEAFRVETHWHHLLQT